MLIEKQRWAGIRSGAVTVLFRRWRHRQATEGKIYRTGAGRIAVDRMSTVTAEQISVEDARAAGYDAPADVVADLRGAPQDPIYLLRIRYLAEEDPRDALAADARIDDIEALAARLARLDRTDPEGPWTHDTLRIIQRRPATRAPDLAEELRRDPYRFKLNVRKLKNLGLTVSLGTGYRISPRGAALLAAMDSAQAGE
ncbi:hypothetical protein [Nocardia alba]|uniref:ASCH domain-containing protein n=1 Tax=Nocardia alba TaxID=225051 RepID=A0A4R1FQH1_9NOCA|nr:hypothetical protein [Nocardia alba]TCJ96903.1 hypothetical protein DFR71_2937 [Nocardia alba]